MYVCFFGIQHLPSPSFSLIPSISASFFIHLKSQEASYRRLSIPLQLFPCLSSFSLALLQPFPCPSPFPLRPPPRTWQSNFEECRDYRVSNRRSVPHQKIKIRLSIQGITIIQPAASFHRDDAPSLTCPTPVTVIRSVRHRKQPVAWLSQGAWLWQLAGLINSWRANWSVGMSWFIQRLCRPRTSHAASWLTHTADN